MPVKRDVVLIGASAGGIEPLVSIVRALPADYGAAVLVAVHLPPLEKSGLPELLTRTGRLQAEHPADGDHLERGRIYVAPPGRHMVVEGNRIRLNLGPLENGLRPSIDVLFRSGAHSLHDRAVGVLLSGALSDGVLGLASIKQEGGLAVVQDPSEALFTGIPLTALEEVAVDAVLPAREIGMFLARLPDVSDAGNALLETRSQDERTETSRPGEDVPSRY